MCKARVSELSSHYIKKNLRGNCCTSDITIYAPIKQKLIKLTGIVIQPIGKATFNGTFIVLWWICASYLKKLILF